MNSRPPLHRRLEPVNLGDPSRSELDDASLELLRDRYNVGAEAKAIASLVAIVVIEAMLWRDASQAGLIAWAAIMAAALSIPVLVKRKSLLLDAWHRILVPLELTLGLAWGSVAWLAMPTSVEWQTTLGAVLIAVVLVASITSSHVIGSYLGFSAAFVAISSSAYLVNGSGEGRMIMVVLVTAWLFGLSIAVGQRGLQLRLVQALRQNETLRSDLELQRTSAATVNKRLALAAAKADRLAKTDPLTQLANRHHFDEQLEDRLESLAEGEAKYVTLAFVDLDNFKYVNDTRGHRGGDILLVNVARRLQEAVESGELLARVGGDEMVLLTRAYDPFRVGKRLADVFERPFVIDGRPLEISASVGVTTVSDVVDRDEIMRQADSAQYVAKRSGGNAFVVFGSNESTSPPGWTP